MHGLNKETYGKEKKPLLVQFTHESVFLCYTTKIINQESITAYLENAKRDTVICTLCEIC